MPWTHEGLDGWLRKRHYADLQTDAPPDENKTDDEPEGLEGDSSAAWEHETLEMQPISSSSFAFSRGETVLSQTAENPVRTVSKHPTHSQKQESRAVFLSMEETSSASLQKRFCEQTGTVRGRPTDKRRVEVSVKNLSQDELRQLAQAKPNETRQYLQNEVMEGLKGNEEIRGDELMGVRWVVTVKHFCGRKVKARFVVQGYQAGDLEDEFLEAATPTPTLRAKHCVLLVAAHHGFELKEADVSGPFLARSRTTGGQARGSSKRAC